MNESVLIKHIVLVGQHLPLMMSAAILSSQLADQPVRISAVEIKGESTSQIESSGSEFMSLCDILKLPFKTVMQQCQGTFSLGQHYIYNQRDWFVPYGHFGIQPSNNEFIQGLLRLAHHDPSLKLESACIAAQAARLGKFAIPPTNRPDLHQALAFAVNLNADAYAQQLKQFALGHNVTFMPAINIDVTRSENQHIEAINLDGQQNITADFWIDCSGCLARLTAQDDVITTQSPSLYWNRQAQCMVDDEASFNQPYTRLHTSPWGWLKVIPLAGRVCIQLEYASQQVSEAEINQWLCDYWSLSATQATGIIHRQNQLTMREKAWQGNCLTVGDGAVNMSKLFFSELYFIQAALVQFLDSYPSLTNQKVSADWFNRQWQQFIEEANDYVQCHYGLIDQVNNTNTSLLSAALQQRLDMFERLGRLPPSNTDAVSDNAWYGLLAGCKTATSKQLTSLYLSNLSDEQLHDSLNKIKLSIDKLVAVMPRYRDFYQQFNRSQGY
tara:strand:+ start:1745 stop:3238 length:1494 start_codon:yes stop_codon:yes gene_type:complete